MAQPCDPVPREWSGRDWAPTVGRVRTGGAQQSNHGTIYCSCDRSRNGSLHPGPPIAMP